MVQKRHVTYTESHLTSFCAKNVTSPTRGPDRPFRCLDLFYERFGKFGLRLAETFPISPFMRKWLIFSRRSDKFWWRFPKTFPISPFMKAEIWQMGAGVVGVERGRSSVGRNHHFHRLVLVSYHLRLVELDKILFKHWFYDSNQRLIVYRLKHIDGKKPLFPSSRPRVISPQTCWAGQKTFGMKNKLKHTKRKKPLFPLFRWCVIYV